MRRLGTTIAIVFVCCTLTWFTAMRGAAEPSGQENVRDRLDRIEFQAMPPVGAVVPYFGDPNKLPRGWVLCDGKTLDETHPRGLKKDEVAPELWGKALPAFEGRVPRGKIASDTVGKGAGEDFVALTGLKTDKAGVHAHTVPPHTHPVSGRTGLIANDGADPGDVAGHAVNNVAKDRKDRWDETHIAVDGGATGEGQHRHVIDLTSGNSGEFKTGDAGEHSHTIPTTTVSTIPSYMPAYFIIRVK